MESIDQVAAQIRFALEQLSAKNAHHEFEHICRQLTRARICSNVLPATGPVTQGGDQGRDFETFRTYLSNSSLAETSFVGLVSDKPLAFGCTLQKQQVRDKIKSDVKTIMSSGSTIEGVHYFCSSDLPVATRHEVIEWAQKTHSIGLEIHDGQSIAELLADREVFWIAEKYLSVPTVLREALERSRALFQLPSPVGDFVGRQIEIDQIVTSFSTDANEIIGLSGMGGIGKTELGLRAASLLRAKYSDGQLRINMRGTDESPRKPKNALAEGVRALIGLERRLPDSIDELGNLYRSLLSGKHMLLFFDNAVDDAQVAPLRPPTGCGMLITSRSPIVLAGIRNIPLEELSATEARELLLLIAPGIDNSVADRICKLCGYLPLAIRAAGSLLAVTADLEASDFANQLRDERTRLEKLGTEGVDISVRASFNLSYAHLSPDSATVFRQLAAFPISFDSKAEEFVCKDKNHEHLSDLLRRSLVLFDKDTKRYRLHELMRIFAKSLASSEEVSNSSMRFAQHYLNVLTQANQLYLQSGQTHSFGLEVFNSESENIRRGWASCSSQADSADDAAQLCWSYTSWGGNILLNRLSSDELKTWCQRSISIAKHLNNREAELGPLTLLGLVHESVGEYSSAEQYFRQAIDLTNEIEDHRGAAVVYQHLGRALADTGKLYDAIENFEHAKQLWCGLGEHGNEGKIVSDIGLAYSELKETSRAIQHLQLVIENARKEGNKLDEANALANLSNVHGKRNRSDAISLAEQAAEIFEQLGYKQWAAQALASSGLWLVDNGDSSRGIERIEQSLSVLHEIGERYLEVLAVGQLGEAYMTLNEPHKAITAFDKQLELARGIGDRHREANALGDKAIMLVAVGQMDAAIIAFDEARHVAQLTGNLNHEFNTLCKSGEAYAKSGKRDEAIKAFEDQLRLAKSMGIVSKELHALKHLADSFAGWGDIALAKAYMQTRVIVSQTSKDPHDYPDALFESATFLAGIGKHDPAILQAENAIVLFERNNDHSCAMKVRNQTEDWKLAKSK
jgi:tetratricopeptide (TPR) repeat protein